MGPRHLWQTPWQRVSVLSSSLAAVSTVQEPPVAVAVFRLAFQGCLG